MTTEQFCNELDEFLAKTFNITDSNHLPTLYIYTEDDCDTHFVKICIPDEWFEEED